MGRCPRKKVRFGEFRNSLFRLVFFWFCVCGLLGSRNFVEAKRERRKEDLGLRKGVSFLLMSRGEETVRPAADDKEKRRTLRSCIHCVHGVVGAIDEVDNGTTDKEQWRCSFEQDECRPVETTKRLRGCLALDTGTGTGTGHLRSASRGSLGLFRFARLLANGVLGQGLVVMAGIVFVEERAQTRDRSTAGERDGGPGRTRRMSIPHNRRLLVVESSPGRDMDAAPGPRRASDIHPSILAKGWPPSGLHDP